MHSSIEHKEHSLTQVSSMFTLPSDADRQHRQTDRDTHGFSQLFLRLLTFREERYEHLLHVRIVQDS